MLYAIYNGEKFSPNPGLKAKCPECGDDVLAKCGVINQWHWAHVVNSTCKNNKPETQWHYEWKGNFPKECVEEKVEGHRADVYIRRKYSFAIEFQSSSIPREDILSRNQTFKNVYWVIHAKGKDISFDQKGFLYTAKWKHRKRSFDETNSKIFLDFDDGYLFFIKSKNSRVKHSYGEFITKDFFIKKMKHEVYSRFFLKLFLPFSMFEKEKCQELIKINNDFFLELEMFRRRNNLNCNKKLTVIAGHRTVQNEWKMLHKCECFNCKQEGAYYMPEYILDRFNINI